MLYYKLHLCSRMCKVMVIISDGPIIIGKLQLGLTICKCIMYFINIYIHIFLRNDGIKNTNIVTNAA